MSSTPTRRSSRLHTSTRMIVNAHYTDLDYMRNTRRTTPTIGTLPPIQTIHNPYSTTYDHASSSSQRLNSKTSKRARPRWYCPPPPEAYLIIRAHRRPINGWGEDWSKKGDGWYVPLFLLLLPFYFFWYWHAGHSNYLSYLNLYVFLDLHNVSWCVGGWSGD
jgi:hypothetical protein